MRRLIGICGPRAYDPDYGRCPGSDGLREFARGAIREAIREAMAVQDGDVWVMNGGARHGPDRWSTEICLAEMPAAHVVVYSDSGARYIDGIDSVTWVTEEDRAHARGGRAWPLIRNDAMIRRAAATDDAGWNVAWHAFLAPWSDTQGSAYTADAAERAKLFVRRHTPPKQLWPVRRD